MVTPSMPFEVMAGWPKIAELRERLITGDNLDSDRHRIFSLEMDELLDSEVGRSDVLLQEVINKVKGRLPQFCQAAVRLSDHEKQEMIESCDEIRMRLLSLLLVAQSHKVCDSSADLQDWVSGCGTNSPQSAITHGSSGVVYSCLDSVWAILLPNIRSKSHCSRVLDELLHIYDLCSHSSKWFVDFSGLQSVPVLLLGTLVGYHVSRDLEDISVCWLKDGILSESSMQHVRQCFNCHKIGGYWFSQ
ncbi:hypothetical protein OAO01_09575 [Oligoflexia bacterium]|nr:hypothetical protein [Oligoflexia bacterium]